MTAPWTEKTDWALWGYASDETHVCFYHQQTLDWIANTLGLMDLHSGNARVRLFRKK